MLVFCLLRRFYIFYEPFSLEYIIRASRGKIEPYIAKCVCVLTQKHSKVKRVVRELRECVPYVSDCDV